MKSKTKEKYIYVILFAIGALFFIGITLTGFYKDIQDRVYELQVVSMKNLSMQGSAVVEKNLEGLVNTLYGLAEYLDEDSLVSDENIKRLQKFLNKREISFQRLGVAGASGYAKVTSGEDIYIGDRNYFTVCMEENRAAMEIRQSELVDVPICVVAVPVVNNSGHPIGVFYGVIETEAFQIYTNTIMENERQYIQIIDTDGTYILQEETSLIGKKKNIFDGFASVESDISIGEIQKRIQNEEQVYTEISDGNHREIVYFTPLKLNDWCVVTIMDQSEVTETMENILGGSVYRMVLKVILVVGLLCLLILYFSWQEKWQIENYNEQLRLNEKTVRIAASKSQFIIMNYNIKTRQVNFINDTLLDIHFPEQIDNAPEEFAKYISDDKKLVEQIREIFASMENDTGEREFIVCFPRNGKEIHIKVQLTTLTGIHGEPQQCVGVIEDATEEQFLREKADRDSLTGLYNRSRAQQIINSFIKEKKPAQGVVHACLIMDLDRFKTLNDTLGHQMGDKALQDVADILKQHFRDYDVLCRLGGDEFLVFLKNIPREAVDRNISSLLRKLTLEYEDGDQRVQITASVGIAFVSKNCRDFRELYRRADKALYHVKHKSRNSYEIYEEETGKKNEI